MKIYLSLVLLLFIFTQAAEAQTIRYVKTNSQGIGNGSSWENASSDLQAMIGDGLITLERAEVLLYRPDRP